MNFEIFYDCELDTIWHSICLVTLSKEVPSYWFMHKVKLGVGVYKKNALRS